MPGGAKLTPQVQQRICDAIRAGGGNRYRLVCESAGVDYASFRRRMQVGQKRTRGKYWQFWQAVKQAEDDLRQAILRSCRSWVMKQRKGREKWLAALRRLETAMRTAT